MGGSEVSGEWRSFEIVVENGRQLPRETVGWSGSAKGLTEIDDH